MNLVTIVTAVSSGVAAGGVVMALRSWVRFDRGRSAALVRDRGAAASPEQGADREPTLPPLDGSLRLAVAGVVAGVAAMVTVMRFGVTWLLPAHVAFVALAVVLSAIDLARQRLPNVVVLPAGLLMALLLAVGDLAGHGDGGWLRAVAAGSALFAFFLITALISPGAIGMGDVKLALTVGLYTGYVGWRSTTLAALLSFLVAGVAALCLLALRRAHRGSMVPFGPSMLIGAIVAVWLTSP